MAPCCSEEPVPHRAGHSGIGRFCLQAGRDACVELETRVGSCLGCRNTGQLAWPGLQGLLLGLASLCWPGGTLLAAMLFRLPCAATVTSDGPTGPPAHQPARHQRHLCHHPTQTGRLCLRSVSAVLMNSQNFSCFFPNKKLESWISSPASCVLWEILVAPDALPNPTVDFLEYCQVLLVRDGATGVLQLLRNLRPSHGDPATLEMQIEHLEHVNFAWPSAANWLILRGLLSRHSGFWSLCFSPANWHGTKQVLIRWSFHWQAVASWV